MVGDPGLRGQPVFASEPVWFRPPTPTRPGTLNLCFGALDLPVVRGHAAEDAVRLPGGTTLDFATVLERVGALAGALRLLGVGAGDGVRLALDDPLDHLLALLACARLGAPHGDTDGPVALITSREYDDGSARVRVLRGVPVGDPGRDVGWEQAYHAGRAEPAPCAAVEGGATAWEYAGRAVTCRDALGDDSPPGRMLAQLTARQPVDLTASAGS